MIFVNGKEIEKKNFPDGTYFIRCEEGAESLEIKWLYESDEELFQLICITKHLKNFRGRKITLKLPYLPNARMDRVKKCDEVFTLKYFCDVINHLEFDMIELLDVHSNVGFALLDRAVSYLPESQLQGIIQKLESKGENPVIYFPDEGAFKRYKEMFEGRPVCYGIKNRKWETGEILGLNVVSSGIDIMGKTVLMVDDICSYGGSLYYSAIELEKLKSGKIYSFTSHTEMSILSEKSKYISLLEEGRVEKHFTTDSLYRGSNPHIEVIKL